MEPLPHAAVYMSSSTTCKQLLRSQRRHCRVSSTPYHAMVYMGSSGCECDRILSAAAYNAQPGAACQETSGLPCTDSCHSCSQQ